MRFQFKVSYNDDIKLMKDGVAKFWYGLLLVGLVILPFLLDDFMLGEAVNVLIWSIAGMGIMVLAGHTGQASLGHAAFLAIGAYTDFILLDAGVPFLIAFPLAGLAAGIFGTLIAIPALRMTGIYLAIATLAMSIIVEDLIILFEHFTGGVEGLLAPQIFIFGQEVDRYGTPIYFYYLCLITTVLVALGYRNLLRSPTGRAFIAIRDSELSAQAMGINIARYKTLAFAISCFITGLAGALLGHFITFINHEVFLITVSIQMVLMVVVGGLGSIHGAFFGAIVISAIPQVVSIARDNLSVLTGGSVTTIPGIETGIFGAIIVAVILFEPLGIYGRWMKIAVWFSIFPLYRKDMFKRQKSYLKTERMR